MSDDVTQLLGRAGEVAELTGLLSDAAAGHGRAVVIRGEAGIGKTRLAETVDDLARERGFRVVWGRCAALGTRAYWPWEQILSALAPDLRPFAPGRFSSRPDLYAEVADAVIANSRRSSLLLVFEDAHWADPASLALLEMIEGLTAGQRLLLLVTVRDEPVELPVGGGVRHLMLEGLDAPSTRALLASTGHDPTDDDTALVLRRTGGNPFLIAEVARLQSSRGGGSGVIPSGARTLLEHRLARLSQPSVRVLDAASVVGSVRPDRLGVLVGLSVAEVEDLLSEPRAAGVVVGDGFVHDLMREAVYQGMPTARRAALHRSVAERLADRLGPAELAHHWARADGPDSRSRAADLAVLAGDEAAAAWAMEQATLHFLEACRLGRDRVDVRRRLGEAQVQAGHLAEGRATLRAVAADAAAAGEWEELARAALGMGGGIGGFEVDILDPDLAPLLEQALAGIPATDSALRSALLARLGLARTATSTPSVRADLARQAVAMAARVGDAQAEVAALAALCDAQSGPDHVAERIAAADRMLMRAAGHPVATLLARRTRLRARLERGDLLGVQEDLVGYEKVSDRLRSPTYGWLVPQWRGMLALLAGELDLAESYAAELARQAGEADSDNAQMMAQALRWHIARARGEPGAGVEMARVAATWAEGYPGWDCVFALIHAEAGDLPVARRYVRRIRERGLDVVPRDAEWLELLWSLARAAVLVDEPDVARAVDELMAPYDAVWVVDGFGCACLGRVADLRAELADALAGASAPVAAIPSAPVPRSVPTGPEPASLVRRGRIWQVRFRDREVSIPDSKGVHDLAMLLTRPGQPVHVLDLVESAGGPSRREAGTDTGPVLDAAARSAYRRRLADLDQELDEAGVDNDSGRARQLAREREFLVAELSAAFGLGGRVRVSGDRVERARKAVAMRIGTALRTIEAADPDLGRHLRRSVSTGRTCCYEPERPVHWQTR